MVSLKGPPRSMAMTPRMIKKATTALTAPHRPRPTRARTRVKPAATATRIGRYSTWNWGTPKSNSPWKVDIPVRMAPKNVTSMPRPSSVGRAGRASRTMSQSTRVAMEPPAMSWRCVGLHKVTSTPYASCQRTSSGNAATPPMPIIPKANADQGTRMGPTLNPTGASSRLAKITAMTAANTRPPSPMRIIVCEGVNTCWSRPKSMWYPTSQ
jgi:hypothetical protein